MHLFAFLSAPFRFTAVRINNSDTSNLIGHMDCLVSVLITSKVENDRMNPGKSHITQPLPGRPRFIASHCDAKEGFRQQEGKSKDYGR